MISGFSEKDVKKSMIKLLKKKSYISSENDLKKIVDCFDCEKDFKSGDIILNYNSKKDFFCTFVHSEDKDKINLKDIGRVKLKDFEKTFDDLFINFYKKIKTEKLFKILKNRHYFISYDFDNKKMIKVMKDNDKTIKNKAKELIDGYKYTYNNTDKAVKLIPNGNEISFNMNYNLYNDSSNIEKEIKINFNNYERNDIKPLEKKITYYLDEEFYDNFEDKLKENTKYILLNTLKNKDFLKNSDCDDNIRKLAENISEKVSDYNSEYCEVYLDIKNFPIDMYFYDEKSKKTIKKTININCDYEITVDELSKIIDNEFVNNFQENYNSNLTEKILYILSDISELSNPHLTFNENQEKLKEKVNEIINMIEYKKCNDNEIEITEFKDEKIPFFLYIDDMPIKINNVGFRDNIRYTLNKYIEEAEKIKNDIFNTLNNIPELKDPNISDEENYEILMRKTKKIIKNFSFNIYDEDKYEILFPNEILFEIHNPNSVINIKDRFCEVYKYREELKYKIFKILNNISVLKNPNISYDENCKIIKEYVNQISSDIEITKNAEGKFIYKYNRELTLPYYDGSNQKNFTLFFGEGSIENFKDVFTETIGKERIKDKMFKILDSIPELKNRHSTFNENQADLEKKVNEIINNFIFEYNLLDDKIGICLEDNNIPKDNNETFISYKKDYYKNPKISFNLYDKDKNVCHKLNINLQKISEDMNKKIYDKEKLNNKEIYNPYIKTILCYEGEKEILPQKDTCLELGERIKKTIPIKKKILDIFKNNFATLEFDIQGNINDYIDDKVDEILSNFFKYNIHKNEFEIIPNVKKVFSLFEFDVKNDENRYYENFEIDTTGITNIKEFEEKLNEKIKIITQRNKFKNEIYKILLKKEYLKNENKMDDIEKRIDAIYDNYVRYDAIHDKIYLLDDGKNNTDIFFNIRSGKNTREIKIDPFSDVYNHYFFKRVSTNENDITFKRKNNNYLSYSISDIESQLDRQYNELFFEKKLDSFFKKKSNYAELEERLKKILFVTSKKGEKNDINLNDYKINIVNLEKNTIIDEKFSKTFKVNLKNINTNETITYDSYVAIEEDSKNNPVSVFIGGIERNIGNNNILINKNEYKTKIGLLFDNNKTSLKNNNDKDLEYKTDDIFAKTDKIFNEETGRTNKISKNGNVHQFFTKMKNQHKNNNSNYLE